MFKHLFEFAYSSLLLLIVSIFVISFDALSQESDKVNVSANVDIYSSYIWRGMDMGHIPTIQPGFTVEYKDFSLGYSGSYKITGDGDNEINLFLSKSFGFITLELWDYWSYGKSGANNFLDIREGRTNHLFEGLVTLSAGDYLPLSLMGGWLFYGADESKSLYLELEYALPINNSELLFNVGYQARGNYYADKPGFVNLGLTYTQPIIISKGVSIDLLLSLIANPSEKNIFFTIGISLYNN
ncbi:MAG: hypothetical protein PHV12_00400 [Bacteroidales bacterium]|jgi:hypothetical protein|nr:hypothetical protein [Bacteroidales bacterium]